jgi:hypothetical protein
MAVVFVVVAAMATSSSFFVMDLAITAAVASNLLKGLLASSWTEGSTLAEISDMETGLGGCLNGAAWERQIRVVTARAYISL